NIFPSYREGEYKNYGAPGIWQYQLGRHFDHWGCEWENIIEGHDSICIGHAVKNREDVYDLKIPEQNIGLEHGLMFLRLTYLRGYEECMMDFAEEPEEFFVLIDKVLEYNLRQVKLTLDGMGEGLIIGFADDLGMQTMLPTGPEKWRKILKPCFEKLFWPCVEKNKLIGMHSDGCIYEIIPDLHDCGLRYINPQYRANGLENIVEVTRGKGRCRMAVNLDLDRQLFYTATEGELRDHVRKCVAALATPEGGLALYAEIAEEIPLENIAVLMEELELARVYK
ncbi:MAG: hypothetical protein FWH48_06620, partial [Oscillospiraceae bacterium]|nr:hypothetical protein [Oscillospiraceae bacterium]